MLPSADRLISQSGIKREALGPRSSASQQTRGRRHLVALFYTEGIAVADLGLLAAVLPHLLMTEHVCTHTPASQPVWNTQLDRNDAGSSWFSVCSDY